MAITAVNGVSIDDLSSYLTTNSIGNNEKTDSFQDVLSSMLGAVSETNDLQNSASEEAIKFALGESDNTHDLLIAQSKAAVALQYTVAVRDKMIEAYKELMQMQV